MNYYLLTPDDALVAELDRDLTTEDIRTMLKTRQMSGTTSADGAAVIYYADDLDHEPSPRAALTLADALGVRLHLRGAVVVCGLTEGDDVSLSPMHEAAITAAASRWFNVPWNSVVTEIQSW